MPSIATVAAAVAAKIESASGQGLGLGANSRLADDYRDDLSDVLDATTRYQLRVSQIGRAGNSNVPTRVAAFAVSIVRKLGAAEAERTWTEGGLLTLLDKITDADWWAEPTGIAGVRSVASDPRAIGVTTERTARVIETVIGPVVVEITTT